MNKRYNGHRLELISQAGKYIRAGWKVGLARGKKLARRVERAGFEPGDLFGDWDGISILMDKRLVVVDIDSIRWTIPNWNYLPSTFKERSRRGFHLFYDLPKDVGHVIPHVKWRPNIDLLVRASEASYTYGDENDEESTWDSHVLVSPSAGYSRVWPDHVPTRKSITCAPDWLIQEVTE